MVGGGSRCGERRGEADAAGDVLGPERWPRSCPPPRTSGRSRPGSRATRQPTPFGPCSLSPRSPWSRRRSGRSSPAAMPPPGRRRSGTGRRERARPPPAPRPARRPGHVVRPDDGGDPVAGFTASANALASTVPSRPTGTHSTSKPCRASSSAGSRTAGCSIALTTRRPSGRPQKPKTASLSASEPAYMKTTWAGSQSSSSAIVRRALSAAPPRGHTHGAPTRSRTAPTDTAPWLREPPGRAGLSPRGRGRPVRPSPWTRPAPEAGRVATSGCFDHSDHRLGARSVRTTVVRCAFLNGAGSITA